MKYSEHRLHKAFRQLHNSAKSRELPVDLDEETYTRLVSEPCTYCWSEDILGKSGCGLDRLDNDEGYYEENVVPCCGDCNKIRGDKLTPAEMEVAMQAVLEFRKFSRDGKSEE